LDPRETSTAQRIEKALLVGAEDRRTDGSGPQEPLEELARLAETAGVVVLGRTVQVRSRIDTRTYIGSGKVKEVGERAKALGASLVIFDDSLTPAQGRNLERAIGLRVLDRSELILDIFAGRAMTSVAKTQVELAQLQYQLPRLARLWEHLSRLGGGIGTRGPGETQLEVDRRRVRDRIRKLKDRLKKVEEDVKVQRHGRSGALTACLVGYTNAGKSSLFNRLTEAGVVEEDKLFATLDSTSRVLELPDSRRIILSDTVGFIRKIPHQLIASFHATLEEAIAANLLLHVVDISDPEAAREIEVVEQVLEQIGSRSEAQIVVLNKIDRAKDLRLVGQLRNEGRSIAMTSALTGEGLEDLEEQIRQFVEDHEVEGEVRFPIGQEDIRAFLHREGEVREERFGRRWTRITVRMKPRLFERLKKKGIQVSMDGAEKRDESDPPEE
jgi:GTP-binding protein HflX